MSNMSVVISGRRVNVSESANPPGIRVDIWKDAGGSGGADASESVFVAVPKTGKITVGEKQPE